MENVKDRVSHEYDSFPERSSPEAPKRYPRLRRTRNSDYGVVKDLQYYGMDMPSYRVFRKIKSKEKKEEIYNRLLKYWNNGDKTAGRRTKKRKLKKKR